LPPTRPDPDRYARRPPALTPSTFEVRRWLDTNEILAIEYAAYWNDEAVEREKEGFWTLEGDFTRMETCLAEKTTVARELEDLLREVAPLGAGADLAAGTLWAVPRLVAHGAEIVYAVEFSEHRLLKLGPGVLAHYGVPPERVVLCLGSFYDLRLEDQSLDFVLLAQALHHADRPDALLREVRRVLRPGGTLYVIGEHLVSEPPRGRTLRRMAAASLPAFLQVRLFGRIVRKSPEFPVDPVLGDHYYARGDYRRMFAAAGLTLRSEHVYEQTCAFIANAKAS
jgi:ubiquinone/menaquinone biosynthesis C-methylase UbiE